MIAATGCAPRPAQKDQADYQLTAAGFAVRPAIFFAVWRAYHGSWQQDDEYWAWRTVYLRTMYDRQHE
jgi:hypothetical protein